MSYNALHHASRTVQAADFLVFLEERIDGFSDDCIDQAGMLGVCQLAGLPKPLDHANGALRRDAFERSHEVVPFRASILFRLASNERQHVLRHEGDACWRVDPGATSGAWLVTDQSVRADSDF